MPVDEDDPGQECDRRQHGLEGETHEYHCPESRPEKERAQDAPQQYQAKQRWLAPRDAHDAAHPRPLSAPRAIVDPVQVLDAFEPEIGNHAGQVRGADHGTGDFGDCRVLQPHRESGHTAEKVRESGVVRDPV